VRPGLGGGRNFEGLMGEGKILLKLILLVTSHIKKGSGEKRGRHKKMNRMGAVIHG